MSQTDTDEDTCPGEGDCDNVDCDDREEYEVTFTYTVNATIMAHSADEAETLAGEVSDNLIEEKHVALGDEWSEFGAGEMEWTVENLAEAQALNYKFQQEWRATLAAQALAEQLAELRTAFYESRHQPEKHDNEWYCPGCDRTEPTDFAFLDTGCLEWAYELVEMRAHHEAGEHNWSSRAKIGDGDWGEYTTIYDHRCPVCIEKRMKANHADT